MLAGDNRQLAPIMAHGWEEEDRPPTQYYQPFNSSYDAVLRIISEANVAPDAARQSALTFTFRLPPLIRELIARVYSLNSIRLEGNDGVAIPAGAVAGQGWANIWSEPTGLVLVVHAVRWSRLVGQVGSEVKVYSGC